MSMDYRRGVLMVAAATMVVCGSEAAGGVVRLPSAGGARSRASVAAPVASVSEETVKVTGRGVGLGKESALKDAYRDAIEKAIGLYVDAETVAKNDEIIKDQILTHSNAYVSHYDETSVKQLDDGLTEVRIVATVRKRALNQKLDGVMPAQKVRVGSGILKDSYAQSATSEKRAGDAATLLENALAGIDPVRSLLVANVRADTQKILDVESSQKPSRGSRSSSIGPDQAALRYIFELRLDRKKYFEEFVPNLKRVLDQISLTPPKETRLSELSGGEGPRDVADAIDDYKSNGKDGHLYGRHFRRDKFSESGCFDAVHVYSFNDGTGNRVWPLSDHKFAPRTGGRFSWSNIMLKQGLFLEHYAKASTEVALVTKLNDDFALGKVMLYELDKTTLDVWNRWAVGLLYDSSDRQRGYGNAPSAKVNYNIVLEDVQGNELAMFPWEVRMAELMNIKFAEQPNKGHVYVSPFVGCFGESYIEWKTLVVNKSILTKIDAIKIELAQ